MLTLEPIPRGIRSFEDAAEPSLKLRWRAAEAQLLFAPVQNYETNLDIPASNHFLDTGEGRQFTH